MFVVIVKPMAFRVLFAIIVYYNLDINQMDVKVVILYKMINQLVYVQIPKYLETNVNKKIVCKFLKVIYGLKQALRYWYKRLSKFLLEKLELKQINADHNIFVTSIDINGPIVSIFVDDIKVMCIKRLGYIKKIKWKYATTFDMVNIRPIGFYLDLKVEKDHQKQR